MKKELAAVGLLLAIFLCAFWNTRHLRTLLWELQTLTAETMNCAETERWAEAEVLSRTLADRWEAAEPYTHVFIRHPEIDGVSDALCSLQGAVRAGDSAACYGAVRTVQTRLSGIWETEKLSLGSIF